MIKKLLIFLFVLFGLSSIGICQTMPGGVWPPVPVDPARVLASFNYDADMDFLWRNQNTGEVYFWIFRDRSIIDQGGPYTCNGYPEPSPDLNWDIIKIDDFNRDNASDIFWRNKFTGEIIIWLMDGRRVAEKVNIFGVPPDWVLK